MYYMCDDARGRRLMRKARTSLRRCTHVVTSARASARGDQSRAGGKRALARRARNASETLCKRWAAVLGAHSTPMISLRSMVDTRRHRRTPRLTTSARRHAGPSSHERGSSCGQYFSATSQPMMRSASACVAAVGVSDSAFVSSGDIVASGGDFTAISRRRAAVAVRSRASRRCTTLSCALFVVALSYQGLRQGAGYSSERTSGAARSIERGAPNPGSSGTYG